jgi:hypothetical protein
MTDVGVGSGALLAVWVGEGKKGIDFEVDSSTECSLQPRIHVRELVRNVEDADVRQLNGAELLLNPSLLLTIHDENDVRPSEIKLGNLTAGVGSHAS